MTNNMKKRIIIGLWSMAIVLAGALSACSTDDDNWAQDPTLPTAIVTLKQGPADHLILQLNDSVQLYPVNLTHSPYGDKEVRAFVNYRRPTESELRNGIYADMENVYVTWVDSIRTKGMIPPIKEEDKAGLRQDPVEIVNDWTTVCEDGYLTLRFRTYFSPGIRHELNLAPGAEPFDVVLYHNAKGDLNGEVHDGVIAFRLDKLPETDKDTVTLTLHWNSFSGVKSAKFTYRVRK